MKLVSGLIALSIVSLFVYRASGADTWTIGNRRIQVTIRLASDGLIVSEIVNPLTGRGVTAGETPIGSSTINGVTSALGASAGGLGPLRGRCL